MTVSATGDTKYKKGRQHRTTENVLKFPLFYLVNQEIQ